MKTKGQRGGVSHHSKREQPIAQPQKANDRVEDLIQKGITRLAFRAPSQDSYSQRMKRNTSLLWHKIITQLSHNYKDIHFSIPISLL